MATRSRIINRSKMATPRIRNLLFSSCSILMASLFALSASVQFNDPDWYFWFPLYAAASAVNLLNGVSRFGMTRPVAKLARWLGFFLLMKVVIEDLLKSGAGGFWSLDMRERVVREKFGSGFVVGSMILHLQASSLPHNPTRSKEVKAAKCVDYGMAVLVGISYGLSFVFFLFQKKEMKF